MSHQSSSRSRTASLFITLIGCALAGSGAFAQSTGVIGDAQVVVPTTVPAGALALSGPRGVWVSPSGVIVIADTNNDQLAAYQPTGAFVGTLPLKTYGINAPDGMAIDPAGSAYISDQANNKVIYIAANTFAEKAVTTTPAYKQPTAIATSSKGDLYIADGSLNAIFVVPGPGSSTTAQEIVFKSNGSNAISPQGIAVDTAGNIYVADTKSNSVELVTVNSGGQVSGTAVTPTGTSFNFSLDRTNNQPVGMSFDSNGNLFILDTNNKQIVEVPAGTGTPSLNTAGAFVLPFSSPVFATAHTNTGNDFPSGLAADGKGNIYLTDRVENTLSRVNYSNAVVDFGSAPFATPQTPNVVFNFAFSKAITPSAFTASLTGLADPSDFVAATGSNCANNHAYSGTTFVPATCQIIAQANYDVITPFGKRAAGVRNGAFQVFTSGSSAPLSSIPVTGNAQASSLVYWPAQYYTGWATGLNAPQGIAADFAGYYVYEADSGSGNLYRLRIGQAPVALNYLPSGYNLNGKTKSPVSVAINGEGDIYVSDQNLAAVFEIPVNGSGPVQVNTGSTTLTLPLALTVDNQNNLYIGDAGTAGFSADATTPGFVVKVPVGGGTPTKLNVTAGGQPIIYPESLVTDQAGNLYIGDGGDVNGNGVKVAVLPTTSTAAGILVTSDVAQPAGLGFDPANDLYVLDSYNRRILEIPITYSNGTPSAGTQSTLPGMDTVLSNALFTPSSMSVTYGGRYIFVSDITGSNTGYVGIINHEADGPNGYFDFGSVSVGSAAAQLIYQQNVGNAVLTSNYTYTETGNAAPWSFGNVNCDPNNLNVGATCPFSVTFVPPSTGTFSLTIVPSTTSLDNTSSQTYAIPQVYTGVGK